jgi:uncharacterized protein with HEPN domain
MRSIRERLLDALDAMDRIQSRLPTSKEVFVHDEMVQVWMVHHLMIIGEAVRNIEPAFRERFPSIPWRDIGGARTVIVHEYFRIDYEIVWTMISKDVPALKEQFLQLLPLAPN